jgi:hypothetical protein
MERRGEIDMDIDRLVGDLVAYGITEPQDIIYDPS